MMEERDCFRQRVPIITLAKTSYLGQKGGYDSVEEEKRKSTSCYYCIQEILQFLQQHGLANYHCLSRQTVL